MKIIPKIKTSLFKLVLVNLFILGLGTAKAQFQPQFTQYMFNEVIINPAYAGARECLSATLLYRNQWTGIDGAPVTQTFNIHSPIANQKMGIGLSIIHDKITVVQNTGVFANYAYRLALSKGKLALGLQAGFVNHFEKLSELTPGQSNDPQFAGNTPKLLLPNAGFGLFYYTNKFYAGLSVPKLILNTVGATTLAKKVSNKASVKDWTLHLTAGYVASLNETIKLKPTVMLRKTGGTPTEIDLSLNALFNDLVWLGAAYRTGDAISIFAGVNITKQMRFGYAYDYTTTQLQKYNGGSHEITLGYDFTFDKNKIVTPRFF
jgi:type IX secretion system PorP/SprF family membrane protein